VHKPLHIDNIISPTPIVEIKESLLEENGVRLLVKRDDLIHKSVSGNKWRKLVGNLIHVRETKESGIITFGGPFSNHIYATAAAADIVGLPSVGIIRGEYDHNNPTLTYAQDRGMKLYFIDRSSYREKEASKVAQNILKKYPDHFLIPEGGSNEYAQLGLKELADETKTVECDILTVAAGTGFTAIGLIDFQDRLVEVYSVLKSDYLNHYIKGKVGGKVYQFVDDCHLGGYGKTHEGFINWINGFFKSHGIPLDPIYNGKVLYGIYNRIKAGRYTKGTTIMHIHTGGLQGVQAYNYMANKKNKITIITQ